MPQKNLKTKIVTYVRVSEKEKTIYGYSPEVQLEALRDYANRNNFEIVKEFIEEGDDTDPNREFFNEMLDFINSSNGCKTILIPCFGKLYNATNGICEKMKSITIETAFINQKRAFEDILLIINHMSNQKEGK